MCPSLQLPFRLDRPPAELWARGVPEVLALCDGTRCRIPPSLSFPISHSCFNSASFSSSPSPSYSLMHPRYLSGPRLALVRDAVDLLAVQSAVLITVRQVGQFWQCYCW